MLEVPLIHPGDDALLALSLGQLAEAELSQVSAHLSECPACCLRIDQLDSDDRLLARLQQSAVSPEKVLVGPDERRSAVRALRQSQEGGSARRKRGPEAGTDSEITNASAMRSHRDALWSKGLPGEVTKFLAPPERPDEIGRLGPYRILGVVGQGGMGVVFRAHDPSLDRVVALKVLLPGMAAVPSARERFLREAKAVAALKHPHVVTVFQVGEDRGVPFLAMEFLDGEPLDDRIRREGRLPLTEVLRIGREAALGLAAAHARGVVHRDVKPANLWLEGPAGHVKLLDFGLAHAAADPTHLTQFGLILGTPAYMAPEQAEGKRVDPRCDLFSLGCVLYQMTTGMLPYPGESTIAILRSLALDEPRRMGKVRPETPSELSGLVVRLLAKRPEDRPASAQAVAETLHDVEQLATTQFLPKPAVGPGRTGRKLLVGGAGAAIVAALFVVLWPPPRGTVRIENDDPAVEAVFDQGKVQVMQNGQVLTTQATPQPVKVLDAKQTLTGYTNRLGMEFVRVPKGKAWLYGGDGRPGESPVEIKEDFYLGKYEVTQEEWEQVMGTNPSHFFRSGRGDDAVRRIPDNELKRFPVESVSKVDAQEFLRRLNERNQDTGWMYRLPTAVEWEYACRGGPMASPAESRFDFYFGEGTSELRLEQANVPGVNSLGRTCRVGSYQPNRLGLYDMHGNVHEMCSDMIRQPDGHEELVGRGGGYAGNRDYCRARSFSCAMPWYWARNLGLRVARIRGTAAPAQVKQDGKVATPAQAPPPLAAGTPPLAKAPFDAQRARDYQEAWAKYLGVPVVYTNPLGMKFRLIPPGEFTMGAADEEAEAWTRLDGHFTVSANLASPGHPVRLTRPFYLAEREVRYREFLDLMKRDAGLGTKAQSECTWFDCIAFCNRLSDREGLTPAYRVAGQKVTANPGATGYRLPTEAEWEFACRAGTTSLWYFGLTVQEAKAMSARNLAQAQGYVRARIAEPNPFGLLDLYAGGWEWCWDWHTGGYYRECADRGLVVDPRGPDSGVARITRGGASIAASSGYVNQINSAARNPQNPNAPDGVNGFGRVVLPVKVNGQASSTGRVLNR